MKSGPAADLPPFVDVNSVGDVVAAMQAPSFLRETLGSSPLVFCGQPAAFADVFSWGDLDDVLATGDFTPGRDFRFVRELENVPVDGYSRVVPGIDGQLERELVPDLCQSLFEKGYTLQLRRLDRHHRRVRRAVRAFESVFAEPVGANLYGVLDEVPSFCGHPDPHDFVILQVGGAKRWTIYRPEIEKIVGRHDPKSVKPVDLRSAEAAYDVVLEDGDALYLPRGWWHFPIADGGPSLHITMAIHQPSGADLVRWVLEQQAQAAVMRRAVPRFGDAAVRREFVAELLGSLTVAMAAPSPANTEGANVAGALLDPDHVDGSQPRGDPTVIAEFLAARDQRAIPVNPPVLRPAVASGPGTDSPSTYHVVTSRPLVRRATSRASLVEIGANDLTVTLPSVVVPLLDHLERHRSITTDQLDGVLAPDLHGFALAALQRLCDLGVLDTGTPS